MTRRRLGSAARAAERQAEASANFAYYSAEEEPAVCELCGEPCTTSDLCFGCRSHICASCDAPDADDRPQGTEHTPEAHRAHKDSAALKLN